MQSSNNYLEGTKPYAKKMIHPDQKYIDALKQNDFALIEDIYVQYAELIQTMVVNNNGSVDDAKDLMQEALLTLFDYANNDFELTCSLKSFLYTICKRRWINKLKSKRNVSTVKIALISEKEYEQTCENELAFADESDQKMKFCADKFSMLGPSCKEILKLAWQENPNGKHLSWKEVAERLDISYNYVRKKANECKKRLVELAQKDPKYKYYKY